MRKQILFLIGCILILSLSVCSQKAPKSDRLTISVIPKGTTHVFWQSIHAGAIKASTELGVDIVWVGTEKEDDRQQQIALVDNQVMNQVSGIVLAPLDAMALRRPVQNAKAHHIPVVIIDSDLYDSEDFYISFIATDNREGGRLGGMHLGQLLNGKGKVVLLRYQEGSASTEHREAGFMEAMTKFPDLQIVSDEQYGGATKAQAQQVSENLLLRFKDANGNLTIDGIFCPNESTTYGMLQALRRQRLTGTIKFVGFDASETLVEALQQEEINGLVVQNPFKMGYLGVKTIVQSIKDDVVEKRIDTGVTLIQKADLERKEIQELINPDLEKWLSLERK